MRYVLTLLPVFMVYEFQDKTELVTPEVEKAINAGVEWLAQLDLKKTHTHRGSSVTAEVASFVLVAFGANGHGPDDSKYGKKIRELVDYLLKDHQKSYVSPKKKENCYVAAIGTMGLAQAYKLTEDKELQKKIIACLEKRVKFLLEQQEKNEIGGWNYMLNPNQAMTFVTCWTIQALWAAKCIGIEVPEKKFEQAGKSLLCLYIQGGSFNYNSSNKTPVEEKNKDEKGGASPWSIINATSGALGLAYCGLAESPNAERTIRNIIKHPDLKDYRCNPSHYYYSVGSFHGMQLAMIYKKYDWKEWVSKIQKQIVGAQDSDGKIILEKSVTIPDAPTISVACAVAALATPKGKSVWLEGLTK